MVNSERMALDKSEHVDLYSFLRNRSNCARIKNFLARLEKADHFVWDALIPEIEEWKHIPLSKIANSAILQENLRQSLASLPGIGEGATGQIIEEIQMAIPPLENSDFIAACTEPISKRSTNNQTFSLLDLCLISSSSRIKNVFRSQNVSKKTVELLGSISAWKILDSNQAQVVIQNLQGLGAGSVQTLQNDYQMFTSIDGTLIKTKQIELDAVEKPVGWVANKSGLVEKDKKIELVRVDGFIRVLEATKAKLEFQSVVLNSLVHELRGKEPTDEIAFRKELLSETLSNSKFSNWLIKKSFGEKVEGRSLLEVILDFERLARTLEAISGWGQTKTNALLDFCLHKVLLQLSEQDLIREDVATLEEAKKYQDIQRIPLEQEVIVNTYSVTKCQVEDLIDQVQNTAKTVAARNFSKSMDAIVRISNEVDIDCKISLHSAIKNSNLKQWLANEDFKRFCSKFSLLGFCLSMDKDLIYELESIKSWGAPKTAQLFDIALGSLSGHLTSCLEIKSLKQRVASMDDLNAARELLLAAGLSSRNIQMIELRNTTSQTLEDISQIVGTTRERVRQVCLKVEDLPSWITKLAHDEVAARSSGWRLAENEVIGKGAALLCAVGQINLEDAEQMLKHAGVILRAKAVAPQRIIP